MTRVHQSVISKATSKQVRDLDRYLMPQPRAILVAEGRSGALRRLLSVLLAAVFGAAGLTLPRSAHAAGFATARFGGEHGSVTTTNPTALYYNPAGIGFSSGIHLFADGTLALRRVLWDHPPASTDPIPPAGADGADYGRAAAFNVFGAPMVGATGRFGNFAAGLALHVPFGGRVHWSQNDKVADTAAYPLAADGVQRWHTIEGAMTFLCITGGLAYRFGPLSIGATFNLYRSSMMSVRARNPNGQGLADSTREGRTTLDVSGTEASFGAGLMLETIPDHLWLGASYQAQPGLGPMRLKGTLSTEYRGPWPQTSPDSAPTETNFPVTMDQALPDIVRIGARFRVDRDWELRLSGDMTRWSVLQTQCVAIENYPCAVTRSGADASGGGVQQNLRRYWHDTYGIHAGASHWVKPEIELFAGLGYETAAAPDSTLDPELPDAASVSGAGGARFGLGHRFFLALSYTHIYYFERNNIGKSALASAEYPTTRSDGGGIYHQWIGVINANAEKEF
jgi:long-chain fatty acid transport protein